MSVARVALPVGVDQLFDYWIPSGLDLVVGAVVAVHLGQRRLHGVVVHIAAQSEWSDTGLQSIDEIVNELPALSDELLAIGRFIAGYYQDAIGLCYALMLPPLQARKPVSAPAHLRESRLRLSARGKEALAAASRKGRVMQALEDLLRRPEGTDGNEVRVLGSAALRTLSRWRREGWTENVSTAGAPVPPAHIRLNHAQATALAGVFSEPAQFRPSLLHGVTGSGKTEVYLAAAAQAIAAGRQVLLLAPEINLTPQLEQRIRGSLPGVRLVVLHSRMSAGERLRNWIACATGEAQLIVATRLGVFAPAPALGLIVVDEEHDSSFKQQEGVRYHARDVAVYRAHLRDVPIILGSATPSLESYEHARQGRYGLLKLPQRAAAQASLPRVRLAPNRDPAAFEGLGLPLRDAIQARLARKEQSLLFVNRRGFAPSLLCAACGWKAMCERCDARLVLHRDIRRMRCHHCGASAAVPPSCPQCGNQDLLPQGYGTQRLEQALKLLFPGAAIARIDRDSTRRKGSFAALRDDIESGELDILVGTQMLAKGHDFPRVTLVGVLGADNALYSAEFRASERLFALLAQVAGRSGRAELAGEVIVQTDFPNHRLFSALVEHDYDGFAETLLEERRAAGLPPFAYLALLSAEASNVDTVMAFLDAASAMGKAIAAAGGDACTVYAPVPAGLARRAGMQRAQVLVQSRERRPLQNLLTEWRPALQQMGGRTRWVLDVDPLDFA